MRVRAAAAPPAPPRAHKQTRAAQAGARHNGHATAGRGRARARSGNAAFAGFRIRPMVVAAAWNRFIQQQREKLPCQGMKWLSLQRTRTVFVFFFHYKSYLI